MFSDSLELFVNSFVFYFSNHYISAEKVFIAVYKGLIHIIESLTFKLFVATQKSKQDQDHLHQKESFLIINTLELKIII